MKALMFGWEFPPHILGGLRFRDCEFRPYKRNVQATGYGYHFCDAKAVGR